MAMLAAAIVLLLWWPYLVAPGVFQTTKTLMFVFVGMVFLGGWVWRREKWLGLFVWAITASTAFNVFSNRTLLLSSEGDSIVANFTLSPVFSLMMLGMGLVIFLWASQGGNYRGVAKAISIMAALNVFVSVGQLLGFRFPDVYGGDPMVLGVPPGLFGNPGLSGGVMAMALPLSVVSMPFLVPVLWFGLFIAKSAIGVLAGFVAFLYVFKFWKSALVSGLLALIIFFSVFDAPKLDTHSGDLQRLRVWKATFWLWPRFPEGRFLGDQNLDFSWESSVFGWGLGMFKKRFPYWDYRKFGISLIREEPQQDLVSPKGRVKTGEGVFAVGESWLQTHNEYLQVLFEGGLISFIPLMGYVASVGKRMRKKSGEMRMWAGCLVAGLIFGLWHFPAHSAQTAVVIAIAAGRVAAGETA